VARLEFASILSGTSESVTDPAEMSAILKDLKGMSRTVCGNGFV